MGNYKKNGPIYRTLATTLLRFKLLPVYNTFWTSLSVIRKKTVLDVFDILSCRYIIIRYQGDGDFIILVQDIALGCISLRFNKIFAPRNHTQNVSYPYQFQLCT